jgi:hypothetical protein
VNAKAWFSTSKRPMHSITNLSDALELVVLGASLFSSRNR